MRRRVTTLSMLLASICALTMQDIRADSPWYGNLDYDISDITVNNRSYFPQMISLSAGRWLRTGIGVELQLGGGTVSNAKKGVDIGISGFQGAFLRWQSPANQGVSAYFLTGYGRLQLDGRVNGASDYPGKEWFSGPAFGIGLYGKLRSSRHWGATFGYKRYFLEKELTTDSVNLGLRYDF